ncbi:MAG: multiheme c-type cytochrome [Gemmatimonadales bacterium]
MKGPLAPERSLLRTRSPDVFFEMSHRPDGYYQTAFDRRARQSRTERIDLVIGSGRRGQTYLSWRNDLLLELPVSYLAATDAWINSPGYRDGTVDFSRVVPPRCLECHATTFRIEGVGPAAHYADDYQLGITCGRCHGDARVHLERQSSDPDDEPTNILNPRRLDRARQLDNCADSAIRVPGGSGNRRSAISPACRSTSFSSPPRPTPPPCPTCMATRSVSWP